MADAVLVLDCGATNVRAIAVSGEGQILGARSLPNATVPDPDCPGGRLWDHVRIWRDFAACSRAVAAAVGPERIGAVTVTTFGVDGALVDADGKPLHPVISWQCGRSEALLAEVGEALPDLYHRSGLQPLPFNTLYRLAWYRRERPDLLARAHAWLFISGLFLHTLTGVFATDATMAGTSMLTDLRTRGLAGDTLAALGLDPGLFPPLVEAGTVVGTLLPGPAWELGLPQGIPVVSAGHDTQFALFGSGAEPFEPVLSSGTWDILSLRAPRIEPTEALRARGVTVEFDAEPGLLNPSALWIASGLVEWLRRIAFAGEAGDAAYEAMITEGAAVPPGCGGLRFHGDPLDQDGAFQGLGLGTSRGHLARAVFEHLSRRTREALATLEAACGFRASRLRCVGGGSRNRLWNQIRADLLGRPVQLVDRQESTVLGAACFALPALGAFRDAREARAAAWLGSHIVEPGSEAALYAELMP